MEKIKAIELFKSFQGEGPNQGLLTTFLRFKKCKKLFTSRLCDFCDTMNKMSSYEEMEFTLESIFENFIKKSNNNLVITGGEPTLYIDEIKQILEYAKKINFQFYLLDIETNGYKLNELYETIYDLRNPAFIKYPKIIYSPKILNESELMQYTLFHSELDSDIKKKVYIKYVVNKENKNFCEDVLKNSLLPHFEPCHIWLMPQGRNIFDITTNSEVCQDLSFKYQTNISSRLHVMLNFE